jgi:hypothetical protein
VIFPSVVGLCEQAMGRNALHSVSYQKNGGHCAAWIWCIATLYVFSAWSDMANGRRFFSKDSQHLSAFLSISGGYNWNLAETMQRTTKEVRQLLEKWIYQLVFRQLSRENRINLTDLRLQRLRIAGMPTVKYLLISRKTNKFGIRMFLGIARIGS